MSGYAKAFLPEPYRILGLNLRPFCLGHYLLMQRFGCGYLANEMNREDLLLGVLICSMTYRQFLVFIEQKSFEREVKKWGKKIGLFDLPEKSDLFETYLKESLEEPNYIELHPSDNSGDWAQSLKMTLMTRFHFTEEEALEMPLSQALADYYKLAESEGVLRLVSDEEVLEGEANAKALEEFAAAMKAKGEAWRG